MKRKYKPRKGMWCLPMGFAELDETITQAALRELEEETAIQGRIVRLLAARSTITELYGDLLIVTFEIEKTGGVEKPGDDAEEVAYFPINDCPVMAFEPNVFAIRYCAQAHKEEWEIQDSFNRLQEESGNKMLSDDLITFIQKNAKEISEHWLRDVRNNQTTPTYCSIDSDDLKKKVSSAISQYSLCLSESAANVETQNFYYNLGMERKEQGIKLHEVINSLTLLRKHLLTYARNHSVWNRAIDAYKVLELDRRDILFFHKAIYHISRGFSDK